MTILGVDPGTRILGYSILQTDPALRVVKMDVLYLRKIDDYNERIRTIFNSMCAIIDEYRPEVLAIEAPFFGKNVQSMLKLGRAQGVTIAAAISRRLDFVEYEPATIKQYVAGNGSATKEQVLAMLEARLAMDLYANYLDASDALAAAYCHHLVVSNPLAELREQLRPIRQRKMKRQSWSDYLNENPELLGE